MKTYHLEISTPAGQMFSGDALQVSVRAVDGDLAVLADHIPFATALGQGECRIYLPDGSVRRANCSGGMLVVSKEKTQLLSSTFTFEE
ncbi:MAG: F0F1 ATP synthase subunit epsilon [Clostridiales bacterium]|nr:F0F1 ATP synthase subunit epsilon [Clostridiales bacterium]